MLKVAKLTFWIKQSITLKEKGRVWTIKFTSWFPKWVVSVTQKISTVEDTAKTDFIQFYFLFHAMSTKYGLCDAKNSCTRHMTTLTLKEKLASANTLAKKDFLIHKPYTVSRKDIFIIYVCMCWETAISLHSHHVSLVQWITHLLPVTRDPDSNPLGGTYVKPGFSC